MLKEKLFQMFITGTGKHLDYALNQGVGGVIFFTRDIKSEKQFTDLINDIKSKSKTPPFLSIDQEGGRVERTENLHERYMSPMFAFQKGEEFLKRQTSKIATELNSFGLNMNFAPCLDVNTNPNNPIIGERAFSSSPDDVCKGYDITSAEFTKHGIIPVIKHFPGHGDADKDSHKELPEIDMSFEELVNMHIYPFKHAILSGADVVMVAHLHCKCFDTDVIPTSLSHNCINYLTNTLKFSGIVMSDDMFMNGVKKFGMTEACVMGIKAGVNMFIYRDASDETIKTIEDVLKLAQNDLNLRNKIEESYSKIISLKTKYGII
ncbi:MAG: hypothetical protein K6E29_02515 [Cyanobacteria bacterium RUI128]|nr:hypothetical protein [Cyanobacteria bacterium RUI128]